MLDDGGEKRLFKKKKKSFVEMIVDKTGSELMGYFVAMVGERPWCAQNEIGALTQAIHATYQKNVHCSTTLLFSSVF